ncbi:antitoxin StbD [Roseovarius sp. MBR-51]
MKRLLTNQICTMTELREPQKVFDAAGGKPVAIMKNSKCIGYLVPEEATMQQEPRYATMDEVMASIRKRRAENQPVLEYLKDK